MENYLKEGRGKAEICGKGIEKYIETWRERERENDLQRFALI